MDVSIIIPVYKRTEWLSKCLGALACQDFEKPFEVVVVDDGSPNACEITKAVEEFTSSGLFEIGFYRKDNGGPASARNFGVNKSQGKVLCFLDDDSVPEREWLREITVPFLEEGVGLVNGRTVSHDRNSRLPLLLEETVYKGKCWATCNIAYRRDLFEKLGGFDERFPEPSWEDNDLGLRATWLGAVHVYRDSAVIAHPHEATLDEYRDKCLLNGRGAAAFCRKYLRLKPFWALLTPLAMARRLPYALSPVVWLQKNVSKSQVKFLWSFHSLIGFLRAITSEPWNA